MIVVPTCQEDFLPRGKGETRKKAAAAPAATSTQFNDTYVSTSWRQTAVHICQYIAATDGSVWTDRCGTLANLLSSNYWYVPRKNVPVYDGPKIRRWYHMIKVIQYIIIFTNVLKLSTLFSTLTNCTGL